MQKSTVAFTDQTLENGFTRTSAWNFSVLFLDEATLQRSLKTLDEKPVNVQLVVCVWVGTPWDSVWELKADTLFSPSCEQTRVLVIRFLWAGPLRRCGCLLNFGHVTRNEEQFFGNWIVQPWCKTIHSTLTSPSLMRTDPRASSTLWLVAAGWVKTTVTYFLVPVGIDWRQRLV